MKRHTLKLTVFFTALLTLATTAIYTVPLPDRLDPPMSTTIYYEDGRPAHVFLADDDRWRIPTHYDEVDPDHVEALVELEDRRFWEHPGVDPVAVVRAAWSNLVSGTVVSGASTITMQLVRMAEPRPRTLRSKLVEALRAIQIERHYTKEEILEMYMNLLPFGGNYEGLETAARVYFGHDTSRLDAAQIATLLAVPQAPHLRAPASENERRLRRARNAIADELFERDALPRGMRPDRIDHREAMAMVDRTPVPTRLEPMPRKIPHLARQLVRRYPDAERLTTTIDHTIQRIVENILKAHRSNIERLGGDDASVVVMDHRTGELKAAIGNFEFGSQKPGQNIAAFDVPRSTGSLLKPFLLARAIDEGKATPARRVPDIPVNYGGYQPENFDGTFDGLVRLDDALQRSLNIPFVNLLDDVGVDDFLMLLHRIGAPYPYGPPEDHGLSYAVGGIDATPMQVATMFSALARRGDPIAVRMLAEHTNRIAPVTMQGALSAEAAWLVRRVLRGRDRPDFPGRMALRDGKSPYAWKTGTSMGYRDAWTAGFGSRYIVVAWAGNLDYRPGRHLIGERAAAPLFFDIIEAIDPTDTDQWQPPPEGIDAIEVCSFSGHLPTSACEDTEEVLHPRRSVPTTPCPYHVDIDVVANTGEAVTPACRGGRDIVTETFLRLPSTVRSFFDLNDHSENPLPSYAPECRNRQSDAAIAISSPPHNTTITVMPGVPIHSQQIPLQAHGADKLNWFVNGRFYRRVDDTERIWWQPEPGEHEFVITDGAGNSAHRTITVQ